MKSKTIEILNSIDNFPKKIEKKKGEILKQDFILDSNFKQNSLKNLERRYYFNKDNEKYILIEEFLFKENEMEIKLENAITINYYINKK
ncbi:hypothetical protein EV215_1708 [Hypnocyclicus thermotrophus]|uniref:Uncharacterized protein n=1 Tax=Hypnocyclicus thermotrophus TaxID=1627895 RepID=A0AA46DY77_9FUSO|nr:hypothetical protein [Hypnocyclicus thermotrophus]TDT68641.1 hypothetical protein EV215_1708 [Hypnocyclicus thermotrophus]